MSNAILDDMDTVLTQLDPFEIAWAKAPESQRRYVERESAEFWYHEGRRDEKRAQTEEWNQNLKAMMAARELR